MTQLNLIDTEHVTRSRLQVICDIAEKMGYDIQFTDGCSEPGYDDKPVALANWNSRSHYDPETHRYTTTDETMPRLRVLLEKMGYSCELEDEWYICGECNKAVRCQPDSYSWQAYYAEYSGEISCGDCIKKNPEWYLELCEGNPNRAVTLDIDLTKYGYQLYSGDHEAGWHEGQNADPKKIAKKLVAELGHERYIFKLDYTGQFDIGFSVWVKDSENE